MSKFELSKELQEEYSQIYEQNTESIIDGNFVLEVDALKSHRIRRPLKFSYQTNFDNYIFKDGRDY
jgi:uncharacterized FlaG/YvyC family protein